MTEHRIRLAKAWTQHLATLPQRQVDLPTYWTLSDQGQGVELSRKFQRPTIDPAAERIDLELIDVPGLRICWINGQSLYAGQSGPGKPIRIQIDAILKLGRNELRLMVDLDGVDLTQPWGKIALVIVGAPS